jgi:O-succinylhomoserine sulfhydrylase
LPLRVKQHCSNAETLAKLLSGHPKILRLMYPGLKSHPQHALAKKQMQSGGPMVVFELKGGKPAAYRFMNALSIIHISNNLGNTKSLVTHPASTTHASVPASERKKQGITDGLLRLSVGIEDIGDLKHDIETALKAV